MRTAERLVLLVGEETAEGNELAYELLQDGASVLVCSGPPGCTLVRGEPCPLVAAADAVVMLPTTTDDRGSLTALSLCAGGARTAIVMRPSGIDERTRSVKLPPAGAHETAERITAVLHHPSALAGRAS